MEEAKKPNYKTLSFADLKPEWVCTMELRWVMNPIPSLNGQMLPLLLEQKWINDYNGAIEWRTVPVHSHP